MASLNVIGQARRFGRLHAQADTVRMQQLLCPTVVGRNSEQERLQSAVAAATLGRGGLVLVAGQPGIGKSRLVTAATDFAGARGAVTLGGRAVPSEIPAPYRPLAEALLVASSMGVRPDTANLRGFEPALGHLVPSWGTGSPDLAEQTAIVIAEGVLRLLHAAARDAACLLVVEDLHWADPESLAVIEYLADHAAPTRVLCIGTLRDDPGTAAMDVTTRLEARRAVDVIRLAPLVSADVLSMARACLSARDVPPEIESMLLESADGVPFLIEELLAGAAGSGALTSTEGGQAWSVTGVLRPLIPQNFADTVERRVTALGDDARRLLGIAALLGRRFDWRLASRAAGCSKTLAHQLFERATTAQLLSAVDNEFAFRHALTSEAIVSGLLPTERATLAARALEALVSAPPPGGDEWRHLAADLAQAAGEPNQAALLLLGAGRGSLERGALATAAAALERATGIATEPELQADISEALAGARSAAGDLQGTQSAIAALLRALDEIGPLRERRGHAHLLIARGAVAASHFQLASEELALARRSAAETGDAALAARVAAVSAHIAIGEGRLGEAEVLASRAVEEAAATGQPEVVCEGLEVACRCARTRDLAEAVALGERALTAAEAAGLAVWRMRALYQLGIVDLFRSGAVTRLELAQLEAQRLGAVVMAANLDLEIGAGLEIQRRLDEARDHLDSCIELAHLLGLAKLEAMAYVFLAVLEAGSGTRRRMERAIARATALSGDDPDVLGAIWGDARAVASLADEDHPRARRELERAMEVFGDQPSATPRPSVALHALVVSIDGATRDPSAFDGATSMIHQSAGYLAYADAVRHGREGRVAAAGHCVERGDRLLRTAPWYHHLVRRLVAERAITDGWGDPAAWMDEAARYFDGSKSERLAAACRALLRRTGARVARSTRSARELPERLRGAGVTAREAEVLDLVGAGLSNAQIAAQLFLSERTVEHHIGWLRRKLDIDSRAQLVAYAAAEAATAG